MASLTFPLKLKSSDRWAAILFLCSKEAKWITGLIMPVDGGVSIFILGKR